MKTCKLNAIKHFYQKTKSNPCFDSFDLVATENGKCILPIQLQLEYNLMTRKPKNIAFRNSARWTSCIKIGLQVDAIDTGVYVAIRRIRNWSMPIALWIEECESLLVIEAYTLS